MTKPDTNSPAGTLYQVRTWIVRARSGPRWMDIQQAGIGTSAPGVARLVVFLSSRRRHTTLQGDWSSDVCSSDLLKRNGFYYLITSAQSGWKFNRANYYRAANIFGPYTELGDPSVGSDTGTTFNSQGTHAF